METTHILTVSEVWPFQNAVSRESYDMTIHLLDSLPLRPMCLGWQLISYDLILSHCLNGSRLLLHSPIEGHGSYLQLFFNYKKATMNIQCVYFCVYVSFLSLGVHTIPGGLYGKNMLTSFIRHWETGFESSCTTSHFHRQWLNIAVAACYVGVCIVGFGILAISLCVEW